MTKRVYSLSMMLVVAVVATGCSDLSRASRPANPYSLPEKPLSLPTCQPVQGSVEAHAPNSPAPSTQEAQTNCR